MFNIIDSNKNGFVTLNEFSMGLDQIYKIP